jgi:hypothetical protein
VGNVLGTGLIFILIGTIGYVSWTRPRRSYPPSGTALSTIRMSEAAIALGVLLAVIGLIGTVIRWLF